MTEGAHLRPVDAIIGDAIRQRRLALKISQDEIAKRWNKPASYVWLIEAGGARPLGVEVDDIAAVLNCRIWDLFREALDEAAKSGGSLITEPARHR